MKDVRPTSGKVLGALFNILGDIEGKKFLDLFAGTGRVGIEALKHGAESCVFVESVKNRADAIKKLIPEEIILSLDIRRAVSWLVKREMKFDFIFADPPYNSDWCEVLPNLQNLEKLFNPDCIFIIEHSIRENLIKPDKFNIISERDYGETRLTFLKLFTA
ncbi:MAG: RsmD family RNA methyltransferase [Synergistaceae bacterium]|nr:RsmD family RNA methyltransferase [Synergistaceae bacterium]